MRERLDRAWIDNFAKAWRVLRDESNRVSAYQETEYLKKVKAWVIRVTHDLSFNKGWFQFEDTEVEPVLKKIRGTALQLLKRIVNQLDDAQSRIEYLDNVVTPGTHEYKLDGGRLRKFFDEKGGIEVGLLKEFKIILAETIEKVDKLFTKVFTHIRGVIRNWGPTEFGSYEREFSVGNVKVVFEDLKSPWGTSSNMERHPRTYVEFVREVAKAQELIQRRGLGHLWYGPMIIRCKSCGGPNPHGANFSIGAHYDIAKDLIRVFEDPHPRLANLIAHELGHRQWFKFMSPAQRAGFSEWFQKVAPTSAYGGTSAEEDWAEVFSDYIAGKDLTRDQVERFKTFLKKGSFAMPMSTTWLHHLEALEQGYRTRRLTKVQAEAPQILWRGLQKVLPTLDTPEVWIGGASDPWWNWSSNDDDLWVRFHPNGLVEWSLEGIHGLDHGLIQIQTIPEPSKEHSFVQHLLRLNSHRVSGNPV